MKTTTAQKELKTVELDTRVPSAGTVNQESADAKRLGVTTAVEGRNLKLYHERFGHVNLPTVRRTLKVVDGVKPQVDSVTTSCLCDACTIAKLPRLRFSKLPRVRSTVPGERIHSDLCGPFKTQTKSGFKHFVSFQDDATDYSRIYLLKTKDEAFDKFVDFCNFVKTQHNHIVKKLRADGAGEYTSLRIKKFMREHGIISELSPPHTPQLNGKAERYNRSIVEMARALLARSGLKSQYWGEACMTACFLLNRVLRKDSIHKKPPIEAFTGHRVDVSLLRVFGCAAYAKVPDALRTNMEPKSVRCVFLGYDAEKRGYRLLNVASQRVIVTRDVVFNEALFPARKARDEIRRRELESISGKDDQLLPEEFVDVELDQQGVCTSGDTLVPVHTPGDVASSPSISSPPTEPVDMLEHKQDTVDVKSEVRRATRVRRPPLSDFPMVAQHVADSEGDVFAFYTDSHTSPTYKQAMRSPDANGWNAAIEDEKQAMQENKVWEVCAVPPPKKPIRSRYVLRRKYVDGKFERFKARLVAKGFTMVLVLISVKRFLL